MIRATVRSDLGAMAALHVQGFAEAWSEVSIGMLLESAAVFALITQDKTGFILARTAAGEAEILTIAVAPRARRSGIGRALVQAAAIRAREQGAGAVFLEVAVSNRAARGLYEGLGFRQAGLRKGYYKAAPGAPAEDALLLRADLPLRPLGNAAGLD